MDGNMIKKIKKKKVPKYKFNCYTASEALYHLLGGKSSDWKPMFMKHNGVSHWFLKHSAGIILDITARQFKNKPDYSKAKGKGFLTKNPSKKAQVLMSELEINK